MHLTQHRTGNTTRWAVDGYFLPERVTLESLLAMNRDDMLSLLSLPRNDGEANGSRVAPVGDGQEVWASGVTYMRSREARKAESTLADVYQQVYEAQRPELFFKANGWRVSGDGDTIRTRRDSHWNVPEPELVLVANAGMEIVGFTIGNDVSSRSIEGENPLYLPQAKVYDRSCAVGPGIFVPARQDTPAEFVIDISICRKDQTIFQGQTSTRDMKRSFQELVRWLGAEMSFPHGVLLMTGTGIVPDEGFTLHSGDRVAIEIDRIGRLENLVE